jgi:predicted ferric reductase
MSNTNTTDAWGRAQSVAFSLAVGLAGAFSVMVVGWLLANSAASATIGNALAITAQTPWYFSRSAGTVAYILLASSTMWGLLLKTKIFRATVPAALNLAMHNILSWLAILFTGMHAVALLWDNFYSYTLADLTIPFVGPYRPGWVGLGIVGFYLMFITSISFNFRKQIGQKNWRQLHYATFGVYVLATVHGMMSGTDSSNIGMQLLYWGSAIVVLAWTIYRFMLSDATR